MNGVDAIGYGLAVGVASVFIGGSAGLFYYLKNVYLTERERAPVLREWVIKRDELTRELLTKGNELDAIIPKINKILPYPYSQSE
jgi:hypothetical protein